MRPKTSPVCVCVCHTHTNAHPHARTHARTHARARAHRHRHTDTHTDTQTHRHIGHHVVGIERGCIQITMPTCFTVPHFLDKCCRLVQHHGFHLHLCVCVCVCVSVCVSVCVRACIHPHLFYTCFLPRAALPPSVQFAEKTRAFAAFVQTLTCLCDACAYMYTHRHTHAHTHAHTLVSVTHRHAQTHAGRHTRRAVM